MELDSKLRERLSRLAEQENTGLSDAARARVRAAVLARRARTNVLWWALVPAVGVAVTLLWPRSQHTLREEPRLAHNLERAAPQDSSDPPVNTGAAADPRPCAQITTKEGWGMRKRGKERLVELERALILSDVNSELGLTTLRSCELGLELASGSVAVHARKLLGGALWVDAGAARIEVRGTVFSVSRRKNGEVRVALAEGQLSLSMREGELIEWVNAGQVVHVKADGGTRREGLSENERNQLLRRLGLNTRSVQPDDRRP